MKISGVILNVVKNLFASLGVFSSFAMLIMTLLFGCFPYLGYAQESFRLMFWNVENLFDTKDDPQKNDNEFLPDVARRWTPARYRDKLEKLAKTIVASGGERGIPDLVGLCEVENDSCLHDLTHRTSLKQAGYRFIVTDSPDQRGIDVALLYQRGSFRPFHYQSVRIPHIEVGRGPTRDILHVAGQVVSGDTLDVFVCHMPSRSGGQIKSEPYRLFAARMLRQAVDSLMCVRTHPSVVVMGDFNDYPDNRSIRKVLCGKKGLRNLMWEQEGGTYYYRGEWGILDHFIVSEPMLKRRTSIRTSALQVRILRHPFLLEDAGRRGGVRPFRTYNGLKYLGGFSDHLPISLDLMIDE